MQTVFMDDRMNPIYEYIDYRKYLKDFYEESKAAKKYFSYRFFAQRAGLNAPILLKMVIDGKRNLSRKTIEKFIAGVGLKDKEAVYFRNLVLFNQAKSSMEKQEYYRVLRSLSKMVPQHIIEDDGFDYFDKWYFSAVREGVCQYRYRDDWQRIALSVEPPITPEQAREAVAWLLKHGLLKRKKNGDYVQEHKAISTRSEVKSIVVRNFNRKMLQIAERSLDAVPVTRRYATGVTVGLSREAYDIIVAEIEAFRDRIVRIVNALEENDRVYQVGIQLFPLMRNPNHKDPQ
jgi:uncharacterized protein (TIGR02147 family)